MLENIKSINIDYTDYSNLDGSINGELILGELKIFYDHGIPINLTFEGGIVKTFHKKHREVD